jgi:hypothetical protein
MTNSVILGSTPKPQLDQPRRCVAASFVPFTIDLTAHETTRLAVVLDALGPHWDPIQSFTDEAEAHHMIYTRLDPDQQAVYDLLVADGVLPKTPEAIR